MQVSLHDPSDLPWLDEHIAAEVNAKQRDRFRTVRLALDGQETLAIARTVGRSRKFVQEWVYRYRDQGRDGLVLIKQSGRRPKLPVEQQEKLKARLDAGVRPEDNVCTLRGRDIRRIVELEFGVVYSSSGQFQRENPVFCVLPLNVHEMPVARQMLTHLPYEGYSGDGRR